jgi:hypothetical protein
MTVESSTYAARLDVDYPEVLNRMTTFFRIFCVIPIAIIYVVLSGDSIGSNSEGGGVSFGGTVSCLMVATALMIIFRRRYPRWWFDFALEFTRFETRIGAFLMLLTDKYPSTIDAQSVHLEIDYPDAEQDLNRWLPLVKWFLAIPHFIVLVFLMIYTLVVVVIAWFAILFTGQYPKGMFDFVVGVGRWSLRVQAYAFLLVTDEYPPFSLS